MANICDNDLFVSSSTREDLDTVIKYFNERPWLEGKVEDNKENLNIHFNSNWTFPEIEMNELYELISNKDNIYMRCLSIEYGTLYHALWVCNNSGWHEN